MGTQIGSLLTKNPTTYEELAGKVIAIDAYNTIYQFLSAIRQKNGSLLTDASGNPTSHLTGTVLTDLQTKRCQYQTHFHI